MFEKTIDRSKTSTYVQYLTTLMSIIIFPSNSTIPTKIPQQPKITNPIKIPTTPSTTLPHIYERQITHTADINFINDRYTTPVTVALGSSELDKTVNLPVKHQKLFFALKILDPSLSTTINNTTINHPRELPMGTTYTEMFEVITDKQPRYPRIFVHHKIHSKLKIVALKFRDHNIMLTLQSFNT